MKRRAKIRKRRSKIQNPELERPQTLELGIGEAMAKSGFFHYWKLKIFHKGKTGIPVVIDVLDLFQWLDIRQEPYSYDMDSYLRDEFGSGVFKVGLYDENDVERGIYEYNVGGESEYVHPSEAANQELKELKDMIELRSAIQYLINPNREFHMKVILALLAKRQRRHSFSSQLRDILADINKSRKPQNPSLGLPASWVDESAASLVRGLFRMNLQTVKDAQSSTQETQEHPNDAENEAVHQDEQIVHPTGPDRKP